MSDMKNKDFKFYVIGAGLPRTGTLSMKVALEKLLPGKCMHFSTAVMQNTKEILCDVLEETSTDESLRNYFKKHNIVAGVDTPFLYHYKRVLRIFPEAKVVLTVRDKPSAWVRSMEQTVYQIVYKNDVFETFPISLVRYFDPSMLRFWQYNKTHDVMKNILQSIHGNKGEQFYQNWIKDVIDMVPADRLLVFNVKEGWEPLCKFLELPIPEGDFPHVNDTNEFQRDIQYHKIRAMLIFLGMIFSPVLLGLLVFKYFR